MTPAWSQDMIINLTGRNYNNPLPLDSILLENQNNGSQTMLKNLPEGITTYRINLTAGTVLGTGFTHRQGGQKISTLTNLPGILRIRFYSTGNEKVDIRITNLEGKGIRSESFTSVANETIVTITSGSRELMLVQVIGQGIQYSDKLIGDDTGKEIEVCRLSGHSTAKQIIHSGSGDFSTNFIFTPGDTVRFTVYKEGYYLNSITEQPQNDSSYTVFITHPCPGIASLTDLDGNTYTTVQIGDQCWIRENLNAIHYSDGTALLDGTGIGSIIGDYTSPYWFNYNDSAQNGEVYGKLYTWAAVMHGMPGSNSVPSGVQGICPTGWHVPSDAEYIILEIFLGMSHFEANQVMEWRGTDEGRKLKETGNLHWAKSNVVFPLVIGTNESGFSLLPGGQRANEGFFYAIKRGGYLWTATNPPTAFRMLQHDQARIWRDYGLQNIGRSVRCVRD
jgi:uncharacterized protein (TIGR02145 family)